MANLTTALKEKEKKKYANWMQDFYKHKHIHSSSDNTISSRFTKKSITACQKTKEKEKKKNKKKTEKIIILPKLQKVGEEKKKKEKKTKSTQTSKVVTKRDPELQAPEETDN